ncbi:MAG: GspE/PulE family protein [Candidatus Beckwithbacteria bacterium]
MPALDTSLLDLLKAKNKLNEADYQRVKAEAINSTLLPEDILMAHNLSSEEIISEAKAEILKIPYLDISNTSVSPEALNVLPEAVAIKYLALPISIDKENNILLLVMANPVDLQALDFIERKTGMKIKPHLGGKNKLAKEIKLRYAQSLSGEVTEALKDTAESNPDILLRTAEISGGVIREAPIAKIVSTILEFAIKARASDVHIEPMEEKTRVRYRIDGILYEKLVLPRNVHDSVISRIKILSHMKIDEKRIPQDGRFNFRTADEEVDLRVSSLPTSHGEKIVMRLLKKSLKVPSLPELGLRGKALVNLQSSIRVPHGIILVTGPTGSGKTTTLYSVLNQINMPKVNIMTLEDPIEYQIGGITQTQVNVQAGLTFASGLRSFLRQDPDIIMVGEIRDTETAELAIQASLTGHLVFSTLHTNSAAGALPRLSDMEMESFLLASSMTCIVGQRVVRKICDHCKESYTPLPKVIADIKSVLGPLLIKDSFELYRGKKCEACNGTGYSGRIGIFEVLPVTEKIGKLILEQAPSSKITAQAVSDGMVEMKQDGYLKVVEGITTLEEVLRVAET